MNRESTIGAQGKGRSQESYRESPYEDLSWEIVGDYNPHNLFEPMSIEVTAKSEMVRDPMFADFGGIPKDRESRRFHLSERMANEAKRKDDAPKVPMVSMPEEEFKTKEKKAYESGRNEATAALRKEYETKQAAQQKRMEQILADLQKQVREQFSQIERQAVQLSLDIAKKLVGHAVEINPEYIVKLVNEALSQCGTAKIRRVRVSPADMEFIDIVGVPQGVAAYDGSWHFEKDDSIKSGCVVDTAAGEIDFRLDQAFERIQANILKVLK